MTAISPAQTRLCYERMLIERISRRNLLMAGSSLAALAIAISLPGRPTRLLAQELTGTPEASPVASASFAATPFGLGVASGDPAPTGVVLWTRLAVAPLDGGGMPPLPYEVRWELANDDGFGDVVQSGIAIASHALAHSVHVDVTGLEPDREYFYLFTLFNEIRPPGRTLTTPTLACRSITCGLLSPHARTGSMTTSMPTGTSRRGTTISSSPSATTSTKWRRAHTTSTPVTRRAG